MTETIILFLASEPDITEHYKSDKSGNKYLEANVSESHVFVYSVLQKLKKYL